MGIVVTTQLVDGLLGGNWPPAHHPASRKLLAFAVWKALETQFGSEDLHSDALLAGCLRDERIREFWYSDLRKATPTNVKIWKAQARLEQGI